MRKHQQDSISSHAAIVRPLSRRILARHHYISLVATSRCFFILSLTPHPFLFFSSLPSLHVDSWKWIVGGLIGALSCSFKSNFLIKNRRSLSAIESFSFGCATFIFYSIGRGNPSQNGYPTPPQALTPTGIDLIKWKRDCEISGSLRTELDSHCEIRTGPN